METAQKKIARQLKRILIEKLKLPFTEEELDFNTPLNNENIQLDSVDYIELISEIAAQFQLDLSEADFSKLNNIEQISRLIMENQMSGLTRSAAETS